MHENRNTVLYIKVIRLNWMQFVRDLYVICTLFPVSKHLQSPISIRAVVIMGGKLLRDRV